MRGTVVVALLLAAGCSELDQPSFEPRAPAVLPPRAAPAPPMRTPVEPTPAESRDTCGAREHADLVGRNRTEIPVPVDPSRRRVVCSTCPTTRDLRPDRLNIIYDAGTGVITEVRCG